MHHGDLHGHGMHPSQQPPWPGMPPPAHLSPHHAQVPRPVSQVNAQVGPPPGPAQPLTMVAPANAFSGEAGRYPWYRVSFAGGVDLRQGPSVEAPRTGETLCQNATLAAAEEVLGADGRVYLRLADGRGWAFDDSALFPHDPSVVKGYWQPVCPVPPGGNSAAALAAVAAGGGSAAAAAAAQTAGAPATPAAGGAATAMSSMLGLGPGAGVTMDPHGTPWLS